MLHVVRAGTEVSIHLDHATARALGSALVLARPKGSASITTPLHTLHVHVYSEPVEALPKHRPIDHK